MYIWSIDKLKFRYVYQYLDHLGNVRLSYSDLDKSGDIDKKTEIIEENNYYPFGLKHRGYNEIVNAETEHKWRYNGIEFDGDLTDFDLGVYSARFRTLDPQTGRWWQIDPRVESFYDQSPYNSNLNDPISYIDPLGDSPVVAGAVARKYVQKLVKRFLIDAGIGAGLEFGTQLIVNRIFGDSWKEAYDKTDWLDVRVGALEYSGTALISRGNHGKKAKAWTNATIRVVSAGFKASFDDGDKGFIHIFHTNENGDKKDTGDAMIEFGLSLLSQAVAERIIGKVKRVLQLDEIIEANKNLLKAAEDELTNFDIKNKYGDRNLTYVLKVTRSKLNSNIASIESNLFQSQRVKSIYEQQINTTLNVVLRIGAKTGVKALWKKTASWWKSFKPW